MRNRENHGIKSINGALKYDLQLEIFVINLGDRQGLNLVYKLKIMYKKELIKRNYKKNFFN